MVEHLVEFHVEVSSSFAPWQTEERKILLKYLPGEKI